MSHLLRGGEPMNLLLQRPEETFQYLRPLFEQLRSTNVPAVQSPRAVESTEGRAFDVVLFGLTPAAAAAAGALSLARLPFRVGRLPVAWEAQPMEVNHLQLSDTKPFHVSRNRSSPRPWQLRRHHRKRGTDWWSSSRRHRATCRRRE
jgi:hypothetical protein